MTAGPVLFARFAYPPNALGYCGPDDAQAMLEYAAADASDGGLLRLAGQFHGAWPYLQLIAAAAGIPDPLDSRVVGGYWIGGPVLEAVTPALLAAHLEPRFRHRTGRRWADVSELAVRGGRPHHNFHVFGIYPWAGMLRYGVVDKPLRVLDQCRVRWGRIAALSAGAAQVWSRPLCWDGRALSLGPARQEHVLASSGGRALAPRLTVGSWVALHWNWVCDVLDERRLRALGYYTRTQLAMVNTALDYPALAPVLG